MSAPLPIETEMETAPPAIIERIYRVRAQINSLIMQRFGAPTTQPMYTYLPPGVKPVACVVRVHDAATVNVLPDVTVELIVGVYWWFWLVGERVAATYKTDSNGLVKLTLDANTLYKFRLSKTGYKGITWGAYRGSTIYDYTQKYGYVPFSMVKA